MVIPMTNNRANTPDSISSEKLGNALANEMVKVKPGRCPTSEEIAALIDGKLSQENRDKILHHLSSCNFCYDTFILTSDLKRKEFKKESNPLVIFKPLALAASIIIVIFSIYLFYKGGLPKTTKELVNSDSSELKDEKTRVHPAPLPENNFQEERKKEEQENLTSLGFLEAEKKRAAASPSEKRQWESSKIEEPAEKVAGAKEKEKKIKEIETEVSRQASPKKQMPQDKSGSIKTEHDLSATTEQEQAPRAPQTMKKMKIATPRAESNSRDYQRDYQIEKKQKKQSPRKNFNTAKDEAASLTEKDLQKNPVWSQANILNMQSQQYRFHIPADELRQMFKQSIDLTNQLKKPLKKINKESSSPSNAAKAAKIDAFIKGIAPLITVSTTQEEINVYPNIDYFLSKSKPGSVEYKFFSLARYGWCKAAVGCYGLDKRRSSLEPIKIEKAAGKGNRAAGTQLNQWKNLYPRLNGIFQEVATSTISHLEKKARSREGY